MTDAALSLVNEAPTSKTRRALHPVSDSFVLHEGDVMDAYASGGEGTAFQPGNRRGGALARLAELTEGGLAGIGDRRLLILGADLAGAVRDLDVGAADGHGEEVADLVGVVLVASSSACARVLLPLLNKQAGDRPKSDWMFPSPRKKGASIAKQYPNQALTRAVVLANEGRDEPIPRLTVHGFRHTFADISLAEAGADLLSVAQAMGHARPSITLDRYGHQSMKGLAPLMSKIDELVSRAA